MKLGRGDISKVGARQEFGVTPTSRTVREVDHLIASTEHYRSYAPGWSHLPIELRAKVCAESINRQPSLAQALERVGQLSSIHQSFKEAIELAVQTDALRSDVAKRFLNDRIRLIIEEAPEHTIDATCERFKKLLASQSRLSIELDAIPPALRKPFLEALAHRFSAHSANTQSLQNFSFNIGEAELDEETKQCLVETLSSLTKINTEQICTMSWDCQTLDFSADQLRAMLSKSLSLHHLSIRQLSEPAMQVLIEQLPKALTGLFLNDVNFSAYADETLTQLANALPQTNVSMLSLSSCQLNPAMIRILREGMTQIENLDLSDNALHDAAAEALIPLISAGKLEDLDLMGNNLTEAGVQHLFQASRLGRLKNVDVSFNQLDEDVPVAALLPLLKTSSIKHLNLSGAPFCQDSANQLASLINEARCPLAQLILKDSEFSDAEAEIVFQAVINAHPSLPLVLLDLSRTLVTPLSRQKIEAALAKYPALHIHLGLPEQAAQQFPDFNLQAFSPAEQSELKERFGDRIAFNSD